MDPTAQLFILNLTVFHLVPQKIPLVWSDCATSRKRGYKVTVGSKTWWTRTHTHTCTHTHTRTHTHTHTHSRTCSHTHVFILVYVERFSETFCWDVCSFCSPTKKLFLVPFRQDSFISNLRSCGVPGPGVNPEPVLMYSIFSFWWQMGPPSGL